MAAGAYAEAIPRWGAFGTGERSATPNSPLGDVEAAQSSYERGEYLTGKDCTAFLRGPNLDRLIALAIARADWVEVLRMVRLGEPDPLGENNVTFGGGSRAKRPLVKLCAHAAVATADLRMALDMDDFFDLRVGEVEAFIEHVRSGPYEDAAKRIVEIAGLCRERR